MYDALPVTRSLNGYLQDAGPFKHVKHIRSPPPTPHSNHLAVYSHKLPP